jgi:hypothetical protein
LTIAALAVGLLVTAMAFMLPPVYRAITRGGDNYRDAHRIVAELTETREAVWLNEQSELHRGAFLVTGQRVELASGLIEITFRDGTHVNVEGPASLELAASGIDLTHGHLVARVPAKAIGFEVITPLMRVIDLGTVFGVAQGDQGPGETHVFEGRVQLQPLHVTSAGQPILLQAGEGIQWDAAGKLGDPALASGERFAVVAQSLTPEITVLFYDNFNVDDTNNFDDAPLTGRRGGLLGDEVVLRSAWIQQSIAQKRLKMVAASAGSGRIRFHKRELAEWFDFAAGNLGSAILDAKTLRIDFNWLAPNTTSDNWLSFSIGHPGSSTGEPGVRVNHAATDYGILLRCNGDTQRFDNGVSAQTLSFRPTTYRQHVVIELTFASFDDGTDVDVRVSISGTQVDQHTFTWDGNDRQLYMELGTLETGMSIDNLRLLAIVSSPEERSPQRETHQE